MFGCCSKRGGKIKTKHKFLFIQFMLKNIFLVTKAWIVFAQINGKGAQPLTLPIFAYAENKILYSRIQLNCNEKRVLIECLRNLEICIECGAI